MALDNTPDIGQPKTCSFKFIPVVQPLEKAEKLLGLAHVEAGSIVFDEEHKLAAGVIETADFNSSLLVVTGIFQRVRN